MNKTGQRRLKRHLAKKANRTIKEIERDNERNARNNEYTVIDKPGYNRPRTNQSLEALKALDD